MGPPDSKKAAWRPEKDKTQARTVNADGVGGELDAWRGQYSCQKNTLFIP